MNPRIREAIEAVDRKCPCLLWDGTKSCQRPGYCACVKAVRPGSANKEWPPCLVDNHALARSLARVVVEEAAAIPHKWADSLSCEPPEVCTHQRMGERMEELIRALLGEEAERGE